jgi:hypothetical protein
MAFATVSSAVFSFAREHASSEEDSVAKHPMYGCGRAGLSTERAELLKVRHFN